MTAHKLFMLVMVGCASIISCRKQQTEFLAGKDKEAIPPEAITNIQSSAGTIYVDDISQLYAAVNDPGNAGATVVLAPGNYRLNSAYPNGGRLELQYNMSLRGQPGHPDNVIIDASYLDTAALAYLYNDEIYHYRGAIGTGRGTNVIEWLTVYNAPGHYIRALIETDLTGTAAAHVKVAHTIVKGASIGIHIVNMTALSNGRNLFAEITDNEVADNVAGGLGTGILVENILVQQGAFIHAELRNNHVYGNKAGIVLLNERSSSCSIDALSHTEVIEHNGVGMILLGGWGIDRMSPATDNSVRLQQYGSRVANNSGSPALPSYRVLPGNIFAAGGLKAARLASGGVDNNSVELTLQACRFEQVPGLADINAFGAYTILVPVSAGFSNHAVINLEGSSKDAIVNAAHSVPINVSDGNTVNIFR